MSKTTKKPTKKRTSPKTKKVEQVSKSTASTAVVKVEESEKPVKVADTPLKSPLQRWQIWLSVLFLAQAAAILLFSKSHSAPIIINYVTPNPLTAGHELVPAFRSLFDINLVYIVVAMLGLAGLGHLVAATIYRERHEAELLKRANYLKWVISGVAGSLLFIVTALTAGIYDLSSLLMIVGLSVALNALGCLIESRQLIKSFGKLALFIAIVPWVTLILYILGAALYGTHHLPAYAYEVVVSLFIITIAAALNFYFQQIKRGRWTNYIFGEKLHLIIGFVGYSAVAWELFAGVLRP